MNIINQEPLICTIDKFLSNHDCNHFINYADGKLQRGKGANFKNILIRTGSTTFIPKDNDEITKNLVARTSFLCGLSHLNLENLQIGNYKEGEFYGYHYDSFDKLGNPNHRKIGFRQRIFTAMIYLNTPKKGGKTRFSKLNIEISPKRGKLLLFSNIKCGTQNLNEESLHSGLPVINGEKWILTLWFNSFTLSKLIKNKFKLK